MGLFAHEAEFRRRLVQFTYWHNPALEKRTADIGFGTPYEILLGVLCERSDNAERVAKVYLSLADVDFESVTGYLRGFIERISSDLDLHTCELTIRPENRHRP